MRILFLMEYGILKGGNRNLIIKKYSHLLVSRVILKYALMDTKIKITDYSC